jgi:hypothetical protein
MFHLNVGIEIHRVASQKTVLPLVNYVRTSNRTCLCLCVPRGLRLYFENSPFIVVCPTAFYAFRPFADVDRAGWRGLLSRKC